MESIEPPKDWMVHKRPLSARLIIISVEFLAPLLIVIVLTTLIGRSLGFWLADYQNENNPPISYEAQQREATEKAIAAARSFQSNR